MNNTLEHLLKAPMLYACSTLTQMLRPIITKEVQIYDREDFLRRTELNSQPCLWLFKHETTFDMINILPLWKKVSSSPHLKIMAREFTGAEKIIDYLLGPFFFHVQRTDRAESLDAEERRKLALANKEKIEETKRNYLDGVHTVIMPEGTTDTDGTVFPIKAGCYNLASLEHENSMLTAQNIPVGLTYDPFSAPKHWLTKKGRNLVFINIGSPFTYEKQSENPKEDLKLHTKRVQDILIGCNTITAAQLAGEYLLKSAERGKRNISELELQSIVRMRVEDLSKLGGTVFDTALLDNDSRRQRVLALYENLIGDYISENGDLNLERILLVPEIEDYRKDNPLRYAQYKKKNRLRYCANRITQAAERSPYTKEVLEETGAL